MNKFVAELLPLVEFVELKMKEYRQASGYDRIKILGAILGEHDKAVVLFQFSLEFPELYQTDHEFKRDMWDLTRRFAQVSGEYLYAINHDDSGNPIDPYRLLK